MEDDPDGAGPRCRCRDAASDGLGRIGHVLRLLDLARDRCPDDSGSSHPRHTYYNNESRWTYTRQSGCTKYVASQMYIAYENSIGQLKYAHNGCNWFIASFPNNTQLLRPYVLHSMGGEQLQMVGDADW